MFAAYFDLSRQVRHSIIYDNDNKVKQGTPSVNHHKVRFLFLNLGHFLDHLSMLIFASEAALRLSTEWGMSYATLIPYATPGFVAFGTCALPAGWLADRWSKVAGRRRSNCRS